MSVRTVEVDGQPWQDGWVGADQAGELWRLRFVPHWWGPVHDRWVWEPFGRDSVELDSAEVKHPLTKIWPLEAGKPAPRRRVAEPA